ncbi:MAG: phenylacetic acid degradation protein PaaD [Gammaproteobacteria bacterium RIFCSPLOWO2_02_FULL_61_13]|nr:MAG: phenylacetic acid degradation protein PaaD [Gammaproteobacteria bacterium RIFCSPLOWO2_02_FULL_61_13]
MTAMTEAELAQACAESMFARDSAARELGIKIESAGPGESRVTMTVQARMLNGHGVCHGGFIFTLADTAFAYACNSRNSVNLAQSCSIDFINPAREGDVLTATAGQHHQFSRTGLYDITVARADGEVVARFRGRSYRVKGTILPAGEGPEQEVSR